LRKAYLSDVSDDEWAFVAPYLTLLKEDAPQREHSLRVVFNGLRYIVASKRHIVASTRRKGSKVHLTVDTLGQLLAVLVTPANEQDRAQVGALAAQMQAATGDTVEIAFVDQGYTGDHPAADAQAHGIRLEVVTLPTAKRGFVALGGHFVLLPRRWVVERSFAWMARFRRLARDYERLSETLVGLHFVAFAILLAHRFVTLMVQSA
jgi:transposase